MACFAMTQSIWDGLSSFGLIDLAWPSYGPVDLAGLVLI
jgi:hypothetical protein